MTLKDKKSKGAWIIHHARKLQNVTNTSEFDSLAFAGKSGMLLSSLSASNEESQLKKDAVEAVAKSLGISPLLELPTILERLESAGLISLSSTGTVAVIGLTTTSVITHTSDLYSGCNPTNMEDAVIDLAEETSQKPMSTKVVGEFIQDTHKIVGEECEHILQVAEDIGFVDAEQLDSKEKLYFNGNLFRRENVQKTKSILDSLTPQEVTKVNELTQTLGTSVCISEAKALRILGAELYKKLNAIGAFDINRVSNEVEAVSYVTPPAAFSKYGDSFAEDALDLVKALVASLTYGMTQSGAGRGRITMLPRLMRSLMDGNWIGPATAIGHDYQYLEMRRVIQVRKERNGLFSMRLLKREIGELAFQALSSNTVSEEVLLKMNGATITGYHGPEGNREITRKRQTAQSKRATLDMLRTLR